MTDLPSPSRRKLLKMAAVGVAGYALRGVGAMAGPFDGQEAHLVPEDKKLSPEWVRSLFARGEPEVWSGNDLNFIGMPVGGLFAGCVYLSGEGQLWNWDVFNNHHVGCVSRPPVAYQGATLHEPEGANYVDPPRPESPFKIEFLLNAKPFGRQEFPGTKFRGEYPVGVIEYGEVDGIEARLDAFSPFIPHEVESSSYPATVMRYTVTNRSEKSTQVELVCRFQHPGLIHSEDWDKVAELES